MPLNKKVLQLAQSDLSIDLASLRREHLQRLREIEDLHPPNALNPYMRGDTYGPAIFNEIAGTYRKRAEAISVALQRALQFQGSEPVTADDLYAAFNELFEPERSNVLEHSRTRLAESSQGFINETVVEANRLFAWFRTKAEYIAADLSAPSQRVVPPGPSQAIKGAGALVAGVATLTAFGRADSRADLDRAAEIPRELERLRPILSTLTDHELSAYSTKSLSIGTFLHAKGHAFAALTEDMLAEQFTQELERRKAERREGWGGSLKTPATFFLIVGAVVAILTLLVTCSGTTP